MCNDRKLDTIFNKTHIETRIERTAALNIEQSTCFKACSENSMAQLLYSIEKDRQSEFTGGSQNIKVFPIFSDFRFYFSVPPNMEYEYRDTIQLKS